MKTRSYVASQPGPGRAVSEDSFIAEDELGLYVVCDGMGAHAAGEVASALACEVIRRTIVESSEKGVRVSRKMLEGALIEACAKVFAQGEDNEELRGMGTTATAVLLRGGFCYVAHVGDSRAYIIRSGMMNQLTKDHTVVMELVDQGLISLEEASNSPYGHVLTRALGCQPVVVVDSLKVDVLPGDRILLCSDGVYPGLRATQGLIESYDSESSRETMPELLLVESERAYGSDDMTAIEIFVDSEDFCTRGAEVTLTYATLSEMTLFEEMEFSELAQIIEHTSFREVKKGEAVVRQGENGRDMFVILKGTFRVERNGLVLTEIEKGAHFGDLALISGQPVSADVRALTDAALLEISYGGFRNVAERDPLVGLKLYRALATQLCEQIRILDNVYLADRSDRNSEPHLAAE